jgi:hypothetical protein
MLIGADVGHPPQGMGPIRPSIAATVASTTGENNSFKPCIRYIYACAFYPEDLVLTNSRQSARRTQGAYYRHGRYGYLPSQRIREEH